MRLDAGRSLPSLSASAPLCQACSLTTSSLRAKGWTRRRSKPLAQPGTSPLSCHLRRRATSSTSHSLRQQALSLRPPLASLALPNRPQRSRQRAHPVPLRPPQRLHTPTPLSLPRSTTLASPRRIRFPPFQTLICIPATDCRLGAFRRLKTCRVGRIRIAGGSQMTGPRTMSQSRCSFLSAGLAPADLWTRRQLQHPRSRTPPLSPR